ncbi:hypothetical protein KKP97_05230 [Methanothermococcus sp. SCGC AD-155-C09]|nr:hypothetical protein [Methanothermococcus sp. SCGC AD-155-C09]
MDFSHVFYNLLNISHRNINSEGFTLQTENGEIPIELKSFSLSFDDKKLQIVVINKNTDEEETYECELIVDCYGAVLNLGGFSKVE